MAAAAAAAASSALAGSAAAGRQPRGGPGLAAGPRPVAACAGVSLPSSVRSAGRQPAAAGEVRQRQRRRPVQPSCAASSGSAGASHGPRLVGSLGARGAPSSSSGGGRGGGTGGRRTRRAATLVVTAVSVPLGGLPGPLYLSGESFDRSKLQSGSSFLQFPGREEEAALRATPPLVRVRLAVEYRVHSRQMLCVGGSQIPFGWSFLSIAKVPASWNPGDIWSVEVELPAGTKVEYKYVILEEQDWTQQVNELSEGKVEYTYRIEPDSSPPDVQKITKQMAIVAWQPGPNRLLQVPTEDELAQLSPGMRIERVTPLPPSQSSGRSYGQQAVGRLLGSAPGEAPSGGSGDAAAGGASPPPPGSGELQRQELTGIWEVLTLDESGRPLLERRDVWGREEQPRRSVRPFFGR